MEKFLIIIMTVICIILICFAAMSISIWIKKNGKFPETEISRNKNMKKLGIKCIRQEEIEQLNKNNKQKINCNDCEGCFLKSKK
jgi:anionic cell wall polymer biosynthesis LytR-Cps2A-Psr (LCP) family protein